MHYLHHADAVAGYADRKAVTKVSTAPVIRTGTEVAQSFMCEERAQRSEATDDGPGDQLQFILAFFDLDTVASSAIAVTTFSYRYICLDVFNEVTLGPKYALVA